MKNAYPANAPGLPNRRRFLAAAPAAAIMGALATPAHAGQHDDELRRLSAEYDGALADYRRIRAEFEPVESEFYSKVKDCYGRIAAPTKLFWEIYDSMCVADASRQIDEAASKVDAVTAQIRALPTLSVYAIAVKLKILAFDSNMGHPTTDDLAEMDWDQECYVRLLREVEALAAGPILQTA